jgi:hypothetical protein
MGRALAELWCARRRMLSEAASTRERKAIVLLPIG